MEPQLRKIAALPYRGNAVTCTLCENSFKHLVELRPNDPGSDLLCPRCGSIQRQRLLWHYLTKRLNIAQQTWHVLHFSAAKPLEARFRKLKKLTYTTTDYETAMADRQYDICDIPEADGSFQLVLCYHVLEHIPDDAKAMQELFRITAPGGLVLAQVPHREEATDEDPSITDPAIRLERFGQDDHVRWYNREDFAQRLARAGFEVTQLRYAQELPAELIKREVLRQNEIIFVCRKP